MTRPFYLLWLGLLLAFAGQAQPALVHERAQPTRYMWADHGYFSFPLPGHRYAHCGSRYFGNGVGEELILAITKANGDTVRYQRTHLTRRATPMSQLDQYSAAAVIAEPNHEFLYYGFYFSGLTPGQPAHDSLLLMRLDTLARVRWRKAYALTAAFDVGIAGRLVRTGDGYLLTANRYAFPGTNSTLQAPGLLKIAFDGTIQWQRRYRSRGYGGIGALLDLVPCPDGSYLALGYADNGQPYAPGDPTRGRADYLLWRVTPQGDTLATRRLGAAADDEYGLQLKPAPGGGYALLGYRDSGTGAPLRLGQVLAVDDQLRPQWTYTQPALPQRDAPFALLQPLVNGSLLFGQSTARGLIPGTPYEQYAGLLNRYSATGVPEWSYQYQYQGRNTSYLSMVNHPDGSAMLAGVLSQYAPQVQGEFIYNSYFA